jgi:hypothetical protein
MSWVDGRGGARVGAGRPKLEQVKKAFRITDDERDFIKKMRLLDDSGTSFMLAKLAEASKKYSAVRYW